MIVRLFRPRSALAIFLTLSISVTAALALAGGVQAQTLPAPRAFANSPQAGPPPSDTDCLACHSNTDLKKDLASGEPLSLYVDGTHFQDSVHGKKNISCVQCHAGFTGFPHPAFGPIDRRDVTLKLNALCNQCHADNYKKAQDSVHARAITAGDRNAAVCTDCHTAHDVTPPDQPRSKIPQTCAQCHSKVYEQYSGSVHGAAVANGGNPDVPTCIDCHGVHNIGDPTTAGFRLKSPAMCAKCHTDNKRMAKYNISTNVLNTYVADFHGTTVELFAKQSPDSPTNKPVCYDCHGVHNIKKVDDPNASVFKENLLKTCEQCHPDATISSFAGAWTSHYIPSPDKYPLVYYINLFYWVLIPVVIGGMLLFVVLDIYRRLRNRMSRAKA